MSEFEQIHFLDPPPEFRERARSRFQIIPVPFEATVSYGAGTSRGPRAILAASHQVEYFNGTTEPMRRGIFTHPLPPDIPNDPADMIAQVHGRVAQTLAAGAVPVLLGGEHTISVGAFQALAEAAREPFGIVQFDAHADLRDRYEGTPYSHACVMRRATDMQIPVAQFGVRSLCREEADLREQLGIAHCDAVLLHDAGPPRPALPDKFPAHIYITFDVDCLDSSIMPATGTPEPGGLSWYDALRLLQAVTEGREVVGFDLVELAPMIGFHACDYLAAKLVYSIMGFV